MSALPNSLVAAAPRAPLAVVYQSDSHGCAAGALATLLGVSYEQAKEIIPMHRCTYERCSKCRGRGRLGSYPYMACAGHMASILRAFDHEVTKTRDPYKEQVYPVLMKLRWGPDPEYGGHFVIWNPQKREYICPSAGIRSLWEEPHMRQCFRWSDEPAYVVKHPKFLPAGA